MTDAPDARNAVPKPDLEKRTEPFGIEQGSVELAQALKKERWHWTFESFARGPDTVFYGSVYFPFLLYLAASDALCQINPLGGFSSGADGQKCTVDATWNRTLWNSLNGSACAVDTMVYGENIISYSQDATLRAGDCGAALSAYREMQPGGFTCNCTGDHAFLPSGLRPGNVVLPSYIIGYAVIAILCPLLGSAMDHTDKKKLLWLYIGMGAACCNVLAAILGPNGLWAAGLFFATCVAVLTEIVWAARASFLVDLAYDDSTRGKMGAEAQMYSFVSQLGFVVIVAVLMFVLGNNNVLSPIIGCICCGLWLGIGEYIAVKGMRDRPAKRDLAGRSLLKVAFGELVHSARSLFKKYPQAGRYLIFHAIVHQGAGSFLSVYSTYFTVQMKLTGMEVLAISGVVLVIGIPGAWSFGQLARRYSLKTCWYIVLCLWIVAGGVVPLFVHREGDFVAAILVGGVVYAFALTWYYAIGFAAFAALIPPDHGMEYAGIYTFFSMAVGWVEPSVYLAIYQSTNSQRLAITSLVAWNLIAMAALSFVDFEQGKRDCGAPDAKRAQDVK